MPQRQRLGTDLRHVVQQLRAQRHPLEALACGLQQTEEGRILPLLSLSEGLAEDTLAQGEVLRRVELDEKVELIQQCRGYRSLLGIGRGDERTASLLGQLLLVGQQLTEELAAMQRQLLHQQDTPLEALQQTRAPAQPALSTQRIARVEHLGAEAQRQVAHLIGVHRRHAGEEHRLAAATRTTEQQARALPTQQGQYERLPGGLRPDPLRETMHRAHQPSTPY